MLVPRSRIGASDVEVAQSAKKAEELSPLACRRRSRMKS